jgi:hypothetical protein
MEYHRNQGWSIESGATGQFGENELNGVELNGVGNLFLLVKQRPRACMYPSTRRVKVECFHPREGETG